MTAKKLTFIFVLFLCTLFSVSCLWAADASPTPSMKTVPREEKLGKRVSESIEKQVARVTDPDREARLNMIVQKLTPYLERPLNYNIRILELKEPNAFSLPGGQMYITTGMLDFLKSESEYAAVIAHELIHADRAHGIVQSARNNRLSMLTIAGMIAAAAAGAPEAMVMASAIQTAAINSYSIDLEKEADAKGIDVMTKGGYNPAAMLTMIERFKVLRMRRAYYDPGIFQTHPDDDERAEAAVRYMKDKGIQIQRKDVLNALILTVEEQSGDIRLKVDGATMLALPDGPENRKFMNDFTARLDDALEMELAPYDIQVHGEGANQALIMKGKFVLREEERPAELPGLPEIRDRIVSAIQSARRGNPLTDYYQ